MNIKVPQDTSGSCAIINPRSKGQGQRGVPEPRTKEVCVDLVPSIGTVTLAEGLRQPEVVPQGGSRENKHPPSLPALPPLLGKGILLF